jgi:hypothetical protein
MLSVLSRQGPSFTICALKRTDSFRPRNCPWEMITRALLLWLLRALVSAGQVNVASTHKRTLGQASGGQQADLCCQIGGAVRPNVHHGSAASATERLRNFRTFALLPQVSIEHQRRGLDLLVLRKKPPQGSPSQRPISRDAGIS